MDRLFSLLADGRAASVMREVRIKRNRGKVISAVLMSHTINVLPESAGKTMHAQSQKRTALCAVWIKKMKILSCVCMTKQTARIKGVFRTKYDVIVMRLYLSAGSNNHLFSSNLAGGV